MLYLYRLFGMIYFSTRATLAFSTWIEIWLVFSWQVWPQSGLVIVLYVPEIPYKVNGLATLSGGAVVV